MGRYINLLECDDDGNYLIAIPDPYAQAAARHIGVPIEWAGNCAYHPETLPKKEARRLAGRIGGPLSEIKYDHQ